MEGTMDMTSNTTNSTAAQGTKDMTANTSNSTAAASAAYKHQRKATVVVTKKGQARNSKKARVAQQQAGGSGKPRPQPPQDAACARCSSKNTKFCYYNNYNLNQPRYFCKACRRYWTEGGTLRLVSMSVRGPRNKRASGSSAASSNTAATSAAMDKTVTSRLMLTQAATTNSTMSMSSPATGLFPSDMLPTFTPTKGGISGFDDLAMVDQHCFLPFSPLYLFDDVQVPELAPGGSDTTPTFLDMLTGGYFGVGGSSSYGGGLAMGGDSNGYGMDMSFLLPEMGASATDPMQTQLLEGMSDVAGELQWAPSEFDDYINYDGGYAATPVAGVEQQQQVAGDQQQEENNKGKESSKNNDYDGGVVGVQLLGQQHQQQQRWGRGVECYCQ